MEVGCPAREQGHKYGFHVTGNTFGCASPVKSRDEIITGIRNYIQKEEEYYNDKIRIKTLQNTSGLDITMADLKGESKLTKWFE